MRPLFRVTSVLGIFTLAVVGPAWAQIQTGSILVRARDLQGAALPGASVTISSPVLITSRTAVTGDDGGQRFPALAPGTYTVRVELSGFQTVVREGIIVNTSATSTVDVTLALAGLQDSVTVRGESPTVDTTSTNVSTLISSDLLQRTPGGRDIWNLLEYKTPGLVSSRIDVGGSESGLQAGFVAKGTPHAQNTQAINGVNVSDPEASGFADFYYDYDSFEEVQVSTGAHPIEVGTPGVYVNMVTKSATDQWMGEGSFYFQNDRTQGNNIDSDLASKGIKKAGFDYLSDFTGQAGGPLVRNRLRLFTSWRDWRVHRFVAGFVDTSGTPVVESTDMFSGLVNATWQAATNHRFTAFVTRQYYDKPQRGASAQNTPLSNWKEDDVFDIYQGSWNGVLGDNVFADARFSGVDVFFPLFIKEEARSKGLQSTLEASTGVRTGSNNLEFIFDRHRFQANGGISYFKDRFAGARHELRVGYDISHSPNRFRANAIDEVNLTLLNGNPLTVLRWNTPIDVKRNMDVYAFFVGDTITSRRLTITPGLRVERTRGYLPAQASPPSRWFPDAKRQFDEIGDIPVWTNLAPRIGLVYDVTGDGKTAVKANYARYNYQVSTGLPNAVNANGLGGQVFRWTDANGDRQYQAGEEGAFLGGFGGLLTSLDPDIKQPYTDEMTFGVEREVLENFRLSAIFTYRQDRNLIGSENTGAQWIPTAVSDSLTGQTITVFEQDRSTFASNRFLVRNSDSLNMFYRGVDLVAQKRFSNRWQMLTSYTFSRSVQNQVADLFGIGQPSIDPNSRVNADGPTFWDRPHIFKTSATYALPFGVNVSGNFRAQSGQPFSRQITVRLAQGPVSVNAEPRGAQRYPRVVTLDLRASRIFQWGERRRLELMADVYNVTNENTVLNQIELTGPRFLFPSQILAPRVVRVGLKIEL